MTTYRGGRLLEVLYIDDELDRGLTAPDGINRHFTVSEIRSFQEAQRVLMGTNRRRVAPDIVLFDISFRTDPEVRLATLPSGALRSVVFPIGPLLALPFLNMRNIVQWGPYSAWIKDDELRTFPFFLVPMGLLFAKQTGREHTSYFLSGAGDREQSLDIALNQVRGVTKPHMALTAALTAYRRRFREELNEGRMQLMNAGEVSQSLSLLEQDMGRKGAFVSEDMAVEVVGRRSHDRISLRSLFADQLGFTSEYVSRAGLKVMRAFFGGGDMFDPLFVAAIEAVKQQSVADRKDIEHDRPNIEQVLRRVCRSMSAEDIGEVMRLCVLFANVHAWILGEGKAFKKRDVYQRLGCRHKKDGARTYKQLFGAREGRVRDANHIKFGPLEFPPLSPFVPARGVGQLLFFADDNHTPPMPGVILSERELEFIDLYLLIFSKYYEDCFGYDYDHVLTFHPMWSVEQTPITSGAREV